MNLLFVNQKTDKNFIIIIIFNNDWSFKYN